MAGARVRLGLSRFLDNPREYVGDGRVGLVANYNAVNEKGNPLILALHEHPDINLTAIYVPEHGLWGAEQAGVRVGHGVDDVTGVRVFSLYGENLKPTPEMLAEVDVLLIDTRDMGCRYTTGSSTMVLCMEAAAELGKPVVVMDRPNPLGGTVLEGNVLHEDFRSFVGFHTISIKHGLTAGELAVMYNTETGLNADLTVVQMEGWEREMLYPETGLLWVSSPNLPTFESIAVYPGTCLFEGTNCSEGRGTTKPFRLIGSPWLDEVRLAKDLNSAGLPGVVFRPTRFIPLYSKYNGEVCRGVEVHITDVNAIEPVRLGVLMVYMIRQQDTERFQWRGFEDQATGGRIFIDLLTGGTQFRQWIDEGRTPDEIMEVWRPELAAFAQRREQYLLY